MRIMIITPYLHKGRNQLNHVITKRVDNGFLIINAEADEFGYNRKIVFDDQTELQLVKALPYEVAEKIKDKYYDVVFIDNDYMPDEVWTIRCNLIGNQSKPIIYF